MNEKYIKSRLPDRLKKYGYCPRCGGRDFYIQHSTFLYFTLEENGNIININNDHDDWNNVEETKCTECGDAME